MDSQLSSLIRRIHDSPQRAVLVASGGGSQALAWLLSVPGATRTVLEVTLPYSYASFDRFIGFSPQHYVARETAETMARVAYRRARILAPDGVPSLGIACTATLITDRPKRGAHRCHIAVRDEQSVFTCSLVLAKGQRDRAGEEEVVSRLMIRALARACGLPVDDLPLGLLPGEEIEETVTAAPDLVLQVLRGEVPGIVMHINGELSLELPRDKVVLPGAFNPLHAGHTQLAHVARQLTGREVVFELSVRNVDKPPLIEADVRQRLEQFFGHGTIVVTTAPLFEEKALLMPGSIFVVGYDTATRLVSPRYYEGGQEAMLASLERIRAQGCRFLVAGRMVEGRFHTLADVPIPPGFEEMFEGIPPEIFRTDISSTELRRFSASNRGQF
ncbi:MAG: hypothetical protein Kow0077_05630 [Anaerolineae bacterium]